MEDQTLACPFMKLVLDTAPGRVWRLAEPQVQGLLPHCGRHAARHMWVPRQPCPGGIATDL